MLGFSWNPIDWVTDAAGWVLDTVSNSFFAALASWVEDALTYISQQVGVVLTDLSTPDVGSATFSELAGTFRWLALVTAVATIIAAAGGALLNPRLDVADVVREIPKTLVMLSGWYVAVAVWFEAARALTATFVGESLGQALSAGLSLDGGIASFFRVLIAGVMIVALAVFLVEMIVMQHLMTFAAVVGPLSIGLRPWPALRDVSSKMIRYLAVLSLTPALTAASMTLAIGNINDAGVLGVSKALAGVAGMLMSVLMPVFVTKFLPLGAGGGESPGRAMIGAAAGTVGTVVTAGGAAAAGLGAAGAAGASSGAAVGLGADRVSSLTGAGGGGGGS